MGAWHYLNTDQSGMWVDPEEHISRLLDRPEHLHDRLHGESGEAMFDRKAIEAARPKGSGHGSGLFDAVVKGGEDIKEPVAMHFDPKLHTSPQLIDGYHRSVVAALKQQITGQQVRLPVTYLEGSDPLPVSRSGAQAHAALEPSRWTGKHSYEDQPDE